MSKPIAPFAWGEVDPINQPAEPIWPGEPPGWNCGGAETVQAGSGDPNAPNYSRSILNVSHPTLRVFCPAEPRSDIAVLVLPGGGFYAIVVDKEGFAPARWLNSLGITAIVATYRIGERADRELALPAAELDARRALRIVRHRAAEWGVNPKRIGVMGFSAGGVLTATLGTAWDEGQPDAADPLARVSSRPDFIVPVYPRIGEQHLAGINAQTPPTFLTMAFDDRLPVEPVLDFYRQMLRAQAPMEMHLYAQGGHGFGMGGRGGVAASWPGLLANWIKMLYP